MNSLPPPDDMTPDRTIRLPAHCVTTTADELRARLVMASDDGGEILVDASEVESLGQAVLQLLLAAHTEAKDGAGLAIVKPSAAFRQRVVACGLAETIGLEPNNEVIP